MSKPDKPIFNQQGGRGKLYGPTHGATYMGTYQMPDGKMDRRMFNSATNKDAIRASLRVNVEVSGILLGESSDFNFIRCIVKTNCNGDERDVV